VVFEGTPVGTPDIGKLSRSVEKLKADAMFTSPTAMRSMRREDHDGPLAKKFDLSMPKIIMGAMGYAYMELDAECGLKAHDC